jgi:hypothetical protein
MLGRPLGEICFEFFLNIGEKKEHFSFVALNGICSQGV